MPNIRAVSRGMAMVDHGTVFTIETQHELDPSLWRVRYSDGRDGVFATDWLINLANSGGLIESVAQEQTLRAANPPLSVDTNRVTDHNGRRYIIAGAPAEVPAEVTAPDPDDDVMEELDDVGPETNEITAAEAAIDLNADHTLALLTVELSRAQREAEIEGRQRAIIASRINDINEAEAQCYREWMPTWHQRALEEEAIRSRPVCPGCQERYAGTLNRDHRCNPIRAASCSTCGILQEAAINVVQALPHIICERCLSAGNLHCRKCAGPTSLRNRGSRRVCDNCVPRLQFDVWRNVARAYGNNIALEVGSHRPFSVEVESFRDPRLAIDRRISMNDLSWAEGGDGSVHADADLVEWARTAGRSAEIQVIEFKSPPLMGDEGLLKLHDDVKKIRNMGFRANSSCGLHVHVDAAGLDNHDLRAIHRFGKWYENDMYLLVAPSRRNNQYCKELGTQYSVSDRYKWLNLASVSKHGTIEYRLHHGCTIPVRIAEWAKLCVKFTEAALKFGRGRQRPITTLADTIGLSAYEKRYWAAISAELNPPARTPGGND